MSDYINRDLMSLILKRLPVKPLIQLRTVCKSWKQIIDSQSFIADHLAIQKPRIIAHNRRNYHIIIEPRTLPMYDILMGPNVEHQPDTEGPSPSVICSVHGVICMDYKDSLLLWNPSIHRLSKIPLPESHRSRDYRSCGLWINPSNNDSKMAIYHNELNTISVFSSTKQEWVEVARGVRVYWGRSCFRQVLIEGVGYWGVFVLIAYFDFVKEEFGVIWPPKGAGEVGSRSSVWKWEDSLSLLDWSEFECNLYVRKSGTWIQMFKFNIPLNRVLDILCVDERRGRVLIQSHDRYLVLYDSKSMQSKRLKLKSYYIERDGYVGFFVAYGHVESLVFPNLGFISSV